MTEQQPPNPPEPDAPRDRPDGNGDSGKSGWARRQEDLLLSLHALTSLPFGKGKDTAPLRLAEASWAYPLIGALIGLGGGLAFLGAVSLGLGVGSAALLAIIAEVLLTGGRNERSLGQLADGFRGFRLLGLQPAGKTLGLNAVMALILSIGLRCNGIEDLANSLLAVAEEFEATVSYGTAATIALVLAGAGSRAAMVWVWFLLPPAEDGDPFHRPAEVPFSAAVQAGALGVLCGLLLLSLKLLLAVMLAVALVALVMRALGQHRLGGHSETLLGATQQVAQVVILLVLSATAVTL